MSVRNPKVLVIATSRKTRGGITSVIKAHEQGEQWKKYHCRWIQTHRDGNKLVKYTYLFKSLVEFLILLPFYDLIHIHMSIKASLARKMIFFKIAEKAKKKIIVHFHPPDPDDLTKPEYKTQFNYIFSNANLVIVLSKMWMEYLENTLGICGNYTYLYNPCPNVNLKLKPKDNKYILFAGTLIYRKGYACLINAFAKISKEFPDWKVVLAGNGELDEARDLAKKKEIQEQVILTGWISGPDKEKLFNNASVFCLPSYGEGFPMAVLEAWAYGIPVVCTPVGGLPEIIVEGINGLLFPFNDVSKLAIQLKNILGNESLRESISIKSLELSKNIFSINKINAQLGNIYKEVLE